MCGICWNILEVLRDNDVSKNRHYPFNNKLLMDLTFKRVKRFVQLQQNDHRFLNYNTISLEILWMEIYSLVFIVWLKQNSDTLDQF